MKTIGKYMLCCLVAAAVAISYTSCSKEDLHVALEEIVEAAEGQGKDAEEAAEQATPEASEQGEPAADEATEQAEPGQQSAEEGSDAEAPEQEQTEEPAPQQEPELAEATPEPEPEPVAVSQVVFKDGTKKVHTGTTVTVEVDVFPADATDGSLIWTSSDPGVATVDEHTGMITGVSEGMAIITATAADGSGVSDTIYIYVLDYEHDMTFHLEKTENVSAANEVTVEGRIIAGSYTIKAAYLKNYLKVVFNKNDELCTVQNLTLNTTITYEDSALFDNGSTTVLGTAITNGDVLSSSTQSISTITDGLISDNSNIDWYSYKGRRIFAHVVLMGGTQPLDSVDLTLIAEQPVTVSAADITLNRPVGQDTTIAITKSMVVSGVCDPGVNLINPATGAPVGNDYGISVTCDWDNVEGSVDGGARRKLNSTEFSGSSNMLTIKGDSHNPTMVLYVPVIIKYRLDYNTVKAIKTEVKVTASGTI